MFLLSTIEKSCIYSFLSYLTCKQCGSARRARAIAGIKLFFIWLYEKHEKTLKLKENPFQKLPYIEKTTRLPKYLSLEKALEIQRIFNNKNSKYPKRNNAIITLFLNTGIRLRELVNIDIQDINYDRRTLFIIAKGGKERTVFLNEKSIKAIKEYLDTRNDDNQALFISEKANRISARTVQYTVERAYALIGMKDMDYSTHTLRHTAATHIYHKTKDILVTKEFLGHENVASTEIYTHLDSEVLISAVNKNPLSNFSP